MKRSEIKMDLAKRIEWLKKNQRRQHAQLKTDLATNVVKSYEANARTLVTTENIELLELCQNRGISFKDLLKLVKEATKGSGGWKPATLFEDAD
ncbi:MAG: hypothetical protein AAF840_09075 [Bacteroidota bacterium]